MIRKLEVAEEDCFCQAMVDDTQLRDIDSDDCNCADCMQAKIQACMQMQEVSQEARNIYNNFKQQDQKKRQVSFDARETKMKENRMSNNKVHHHNPLPQWRANDVQNKTTVHKVRSSKHLKPKTQVICERMERKHFKMQFKPSDDIEIPEMPQLLPQRIDVEPEKRDYNQAQMMQLVNQKIKQNLLKHRHAKLSEKLAEREEDDRKKERLKKLNDMARQIIKTEPKKLPGSRKAWNYTPAAQQPKIQACCHNIPVKPKTDSSKYDREQLEKHEFLKNLYKRIKEEYRGNKRRSANEPIDCQYHREEIDQEEKAELQKKMKEYAAKAIQQQRRNRENEQKNQKIIEGRLKGLDLQALKIIKNTKKAKIANRPQFKIEAPEQPVKQAQKKVQAPAEVIKNEQKPSSSHQVKTKKSKNRKDSQPVSRELFPEEMYVKDTAPVDKFYVWNVPISQQQQQQIFSQQKPSKVTQSKPFRPEVQQHIMQNMKKNIDKKRSQTREQQFEEKVNKKKAELQKEYKGPTQPIERDARFLDVQSYKRRN